MGRERWATGSSVSYRKIIPTWCSGKEFSQKKKKKEFSLQYRRCRRCGFNPWVREIPWRRKWQPTPVLLPGEFYG